jgi:exopolysaccharide biosynthesis protein
MTNAKLFSLLLAFCLNWGCRTLPTHPSFSDRGVQSQTIVTQEGQTAHVATVDMRLAELHIVKPPLKKLMTTSAQARMHGALIAINGGFFGHDGAPVGALKIGGSWISKPPRQKWRGVVGFDTKNRFVFDRLIYENGVVSNGESKFAKSNWWESIDNILGGAPLLIHESKKLDPSPEGTLSTFLTERYARTAICLCQENIIKLVVVDGGDRKANLISQPAGMTIDELAEFLLSLGCQEAVNLDGGYSSSYVAQGRKINQFSIASMPEREVSTVLIVKSRKKDIESKRDENPI